MPCAGLDLTHDNGGYYLRGPNSWGEQWTGGYGSDPHQAGWFKLDESQCSAIEDYGAWALCAETFSDADPEPHAAGRD